MKTLLMILMVGFTACAQTSKPAEKPQSKAPVKCAKGYPIEPGQKLDEFGSQASGGGPQMMTHEISPGCWDWVVNEKAYKWQLEEESKRSALYFALRTRVLTDKEWKEVVEYGDRLNIQSDVPYHAAEKSKELNDAYLKQFMMRLAAEQAKNAAKEPQ